MESVKIDRIEGPVCIKGNVPGSKSILARAMVFAALSDGKCVISNASLAEDSRVMMNALRDLGFQVYYNASLKVIRVYGRNGEIPRKEAAVYVGSAGTAARFLTAMLAFSDGTFTVNASPQLCARPMAGLFSALKSMGVKIKCQGKEGHLPITITGRKPKPGTPVNINVDAAESTQFVSGILMALGYLPNQSTITVSGNTHNSYIDMTVSVARFFGCNIVKEGNTYRVNGNGAYKCADVEAEPDVSSACYLYAVPMLLGGRASVNGVVKTSIQGDMQFLNLMEKLGAKVTADDKGEICIVNEAGSLAEGDMTIDMSDYSDQVATVAVIASARKGSTRITGIGHIKKQESNRILSVCENLEKCGIKCTRGKDYIVIEGGSPRGGSINPYRDHRIAMAFSVLGLYTGGMRIEDCKCVDKSFVGFYDELAAITQAGEES